MDLVFSLLRANAQLQLSRGFTPLPWGSPLHNKANALSMVKPGGQRIYPRSGEHGSQPPSASSLPPNAAPGLTRKQHLHVATVGHFLLLHLQLLGRATPLRLEDFELTTKASTPPRRHAVNLVNRGAGRGGDKSNGPPSAQLTEVFSWNCLSPSGHSHA